MIIRRTPQPENIIALEIEKYEQSIALMRDEVIESHRLDSLKPMRLTTWEILEPSERKMPRSSKRAPEVGKGYVPSKSHHQQTDFKPKLPNSAIRASP